MACLLVSGILPGTAAAYPVDVNQGVLGYFALGGSVTNQVTITLVGGTYVIDDPGDLSVPLLPGAVTAGCTPFDNNTVTCPAAAITSIDIRTGLGDDVIDLSGISLPSQVIAGDGDDVFIGGAGEDTFVWNPGDDNDFFDGGPGMDTLSFSGSNVGEIITVTRDGAGFDLTRNVASVVMEVENAETLDLKTFGGLDVVNTVALVATRQILQDGADGALDELRVDGQGLCVSRVSDHLGDRFEVIGGKPIFFFEFSSAALVNDLCGGLADLSAGALRYTDTASVANRLRVSRSADRYVLDDPGEAVVTLTENAIAAGCVSVDANTASCPQSAVASFEILTDAGDDDVDLRGALAGALVTGGDGNDVLRGGDGDDTFFANPFEDDDSIDGGPGLDTFVFSGSDAGEDIAVEPDGAGFVLIHENAGLSTDVANAEALEVATLGGDDRVRTSGLVETAQRIVDGDDGIATDTLTIDALGLCVTRQGDVFDVDGRQPIELVRYTSVLVENTCGPDPCANAVPTQGCTVNGVKNQLCVGTPARDTIVGTAGDDVIVSGDGNDRVRAGAGRDLVCGEAGDDTLAGGPGDDTLVGGDGEDKLKGDSGDDALLGGRDDDVLSGGADLDELDGGDGDDRVRGGGDADLLQGGAGTDLLDGGPAADDCVDYDQSGPFPRCEGP